MAIENKDTKMIKLLLKHKPDLNFRNKKLDTPLHIALYNENGLSKEMIFRIMDKSDLNAQNINGITPMHILTKNNTWSEYSVLIKSKKIRLNQKDNNNKTSIYYVNEAEIHNFLNIIKEGYIQVNNKKHKLNLTKKCNGSENTKCKNKIIKYIYESENSMNSDSNNSNNINNSDTIVIPETTNTPVSYGLFNSDMIHSVIYTLCFLEKYNNLFIPYQYYDEDKYKTVLDRLVMQNYTISEKGEMMYDIINIYNEFFFEIAPYLLLWSSDDLYYYDQRLGLYTEKILKDDKIRFIMFKLTQVLDKGAHANILLYDKKINKLDHFEPYGYSDIFLMICIYLLKKYLMTFYLKTINISHQVNLKILAFKLFQMRVIIRFSMML